MASHVRGGEEGDEVPRWRRLASTATRLILPSLGVVIRTAAPPILASRGRVYVLPPALPVGSFLVGVIDHFVVADPSDIVPRGRIDVVPMACGSARGWAEEKSGREKK